MNHNQPLNQAQNLNQGLIVVMIQAKPRMKNVDVGVFTHDSVTTGEYGTWQQVRLTGKKKLAFDIAMEKDTFFEAKHAIGRNPGKLQIIEMPFYF